jgi:hypothetical protein
MRPFGHPHLDHGRKSHRHGHPISQTTVRLFCNSRDFYYLVYQSKTDGVEVKSIRQGYPYKRSIGCFSRGNVGYSCIHNCQQRNGKKSLAMASSMSSWQLSVVRSYVIGCFGSEQGYDSCAYGEVGRSLYVGKNWQYA